MDNSNLNIYDTVTIKNPDIESIKVVYNKHDYGEIPAGAVKRLPRFLAQHACKHLVDQILNRQGIILSNQAERLKWEKEIVMDEELITPTVTKTREQLLEEEIERLNSEKANATNTDGLNGILHKKRADAPALPEDNDGSSTPVVTPADVPAPSEVPSVEPASLSSTQDATGGENGGVHPELAKLAPQPTNTDPNAPQVMPTREELYSWLGNEMQMNMEDPKTKATLDAMEVPAIVTEFKYFDLKA